MNALMTPLRRTALTVAVLAAGAAPAAAQDLPAAADLIARYQQAIGGIDILAQRQSMHATGEFSMPGQGLTAEIETFAARPNKAAMRVSLPGFGEIRSGYTGEIAWSVNPMEGPRIMEGKELAQAAEESLFDSSLRLPANITAAETVERTTIGGRACVKVRLTWQSGRNTYDCYSEETGLIVGTIASQESNMGTIEAITLMDDYKEFGGMLMPTRMTIQIMGMEQIITLHEVHFDVVDDAVFAAPAEIPAISGS
jgi:hypothetical protein